MNFPKTNNFPKTHFFKTLCLLGFLFIGGFISVWSQQGIGTNQPNPSSALEISSQDKGVLIPRMTTTMRDAIVNPALGLMVFNTTTLCLEINTSSNTLIPVWECMGTGQRIITSLACYAATVSGSIFTGKAANAEISIPYGGGNASSYAGGTTISSGQALGATGLTATLQAGNLNTGTGLLTYTVSGTMATSGNAYFDISFGGQHCVLVVPVNDSSSGGTAVVSSWNCAGTATGTLYMGQIPNGVTKTVYANVTQAGSYNIKAVSNGVTYSASGNFAGAGSNIEVVLVATGIPTAAGTASFTLDTDPNCSFDSVILDASSGGSAAVSNWDCNGTSTGSLTLGLAVSGVTQEITANVSATGTYDLTATANGITFTASGTFAGTGSQTITLTATGTPTAAGTHSFALSTTPGCSFDRTTAFDPSSGGSAVVDAWDCSGAATGSSTVGISSAGNTKTITASVTTAGSYNVSATANGVTYSAAGTFAGTGSQTITLTATGTPTAGGTTTFTLNTTPNCSFSIDSTDPSSGGTATVSNWDCNGTSTGSLTLGLAVSGVTQEITANVSATGTYELTATANGITFTASGTFAGTGLQTITLTATGTPTAIGTHSYTLSTTPGCSFDRTTTLDPSSGGSAAVEAWDCSGTATGSSTIGVSSAGHTKTITASVTTAGSYNLSATANGVTYSAAGTFTVTGTQTVTLTATGVPIAGGTATYTLSTTPGCSFNTFTTHPSSGGSALVSSWNCSGTSTGTPTVGLPASGITQEITATVSTTGTYDLTATANGITFTASGTFAGTGSQTITLTATGTPTAIGTHSYTLSTTPDCSFDRTTVADPTSGGSAVVDAWDCTGAATGSSTVGISSAGNTKTITASVTTAGSYSVSAAANGVTYSAVGTFAGTGSQTITLTATGTPTAGGTATYTLSTTPNCSFNIETTDLSSGGSAAVTAWDCSGTSTGTPTVGIAASGITQEITANVSTTGSYDLSATANGITFTASGTFAGTGSQTITLTATGTPTAIGTHSYTLSTTPDCSFDRTTVADPTSGGTAVVDAWDCTGTATGSSTVGISSAGNTKTITASVTTVGSYSVSATANGVTYSAAGTFAGIGAQSVVLTATGTPTAGGTATYTLSTTPNCSFNIETTDLSSGGSAAVTAWDCSGTSTGTPTLDIAVSGVSQQVTANVSTTGSYDLSATANGITFTASGTFAGTGSQTITLTATGTPTAIGTHSYTLSTTPGCSFDFETILALAVDCSSAATSGTLYKDFVVGGTAGNFSYSIEIGNINSEAVTATFATTDLTPSGITGSLGVVSVNPAGAVSIAANSTQTVVYTFGGTPTASGTLNLDWAANNLSCATSTATVLLGTASFTLPVVFDIDTRYVSLVDNGANQVEVSVPYTNAVGAYSAFSSGAFVLADTTSDTNNMRMSYPAGTFDPSGSGSVTVTIEVDGDGSYDVAQPATSSDSITIVSLPFFYNDNTPSEGDVVLKAILSEELLPSGTTCDPGVFIDGTIANNNVRPYLTTSLANYDAAANGDFVQITKAEYEAIAAAANFDIVGSPPTVNTASSFGGSYFEIFDEAAGGAAANKTYVAFGFFGGTAGDTINYLLSANDGTATSDWVSFDVTLDPVDDQTFWAVKNSSINFNTETRLGVHRTGHMYFGTGPTAYRYRSNLTPDCSVDVLSSGSVPLGITAIVR